VTAVDVKGAAASPRPIGLLAELTHRCPLGCPYCSNPIALDRAGRELDSASWARVFREAAQLGVLQVHLSGGEPAARRDLAAITAAAHDAGLYTNLITSAVGLTPQRLAALVEAGLDHVQISIQDSIAASADHIAGYAGAFARKAALAAEVVRCKLPLTVNAVVHRANIERIADMVELAVTWGASRIEIALWLGARQPRPLDADARAGRASGRSGRAPAQRASRAHRHRCSRGGLLCALSQTMSRRLGATLVECDAGRQGAPLSCGGNHSRP
jgi:coenzyme PQQ biosynthesis enzyme PqqE